MSRAWGNQHTSRKDALLRILHEARDYLALGEVDSAQAMLDIWRERYAMTPASTRRRWRCGQ